MSGTPVHEHKHGGGLKPLLSYQCYLSHRVFIIVLELFKYLTQIRYTEWCNTILKVNLSIFFNIE